MVSVGQLVVCLISFIQLSSCESSELDIDERIQNAEYTYSELFPHAVAIQEFHGFELFVKIGFWYYVCSGSIVDKRWVLTEKRCANSYNHYRIVFDRDVLWDYWTDSGHVRYVDDVIYEPGLVPIYPLAMLFLESDLIYSTNVDQVQLMTKELESRLKIDVAEFAGWGESYLGEGSSYHYLRSMQVKIRPNSSVEFFVTVLNDEGGPCPDDSGAGVIVRDSMGTFLLGMVLGTRTGCEEISLARISKHEPWITETIISKD